MKKLSVILLAILLLVVLTTRPTFSADLSALINVYRNQVNLEANGALVRADNFLYRGTTYIPIRAAAELLGKDVGWNVVTRTASINDRSYQIEALSGLLPDQTGYRWMYDGFAEYGHQMVLEKIVDEAAKRTYIISGEVGDPSGGESTRDRRISLKYVITGNRLTQEKSEAAMMDSKFDQLILMETPLVIGTFWTETAVDKNGKATKINSLIKKVELTDEGKKQYTVRYQDAGGPYFEERVIREGAGIVQFEKLLELADTSFPAGYALFLGGDLRQISVNLYFPDPQADKVHLEQRTILISDARTALGALQALIDGPADPVLRSSIPEGTRILSISIQNRICTVDFSQEFIDNHPGGSAGELMTLASIVNTLTDFDSIDQVQILVEGVAGKTLGQILLDRPLGRMADLIGQ